MATGRSRLRLRTGACGPPPGLCLKGGPRFFPPRRHLCLVPLACPLHRLLQRPAKLTHQPGEVGGMIAHAEGALDHGRHPLGGPDVATKAVHLGALRQQRRHLRPLLGRQPWLLAGAWLGAQRLPAAALSGRRQPLTDRTGRDAQRLGNPRPRPTRLVPLPCPQPSAFPPVPWCIVVVHAPRSTTPASYGLDSSAAVSKCNSSDTAVISAVETVRRCCENARKSA